MLRAVVVSLLVAVASCSTSTAATDAGAGPTPSCDPPTYDTSAFAAACAAGTMMPVALGSGREVACDGAQIALLDGATIRTFDLDGAPLEAAAFPSSGGLIATDCGFAAGALEGGGVRSRLHVFDHDLVEHGAQPELEGYSTRLAWTGTQFASFVGYPAGSEVNRVSFFDRSGGLVSTDVGEWALSAATVVWDGSQYIVAGLGGVPGGALTGLDAAGHRSWSTGGMSSGFPPAIVPTPEGFLEVASWHVAPRSHRGDLRGPTVDLQAALAVTDLYTPFAIASGGGSVRVVYTELGADGATSLRVAELDAAAMPGPSRAVPGVAPAERRPLTLLWAGYSFAAFFMPADAPTTLSMERICP